MPETKQLEPSRLLGAPAAHISGDMCEGDRGEMRRVSGTSNKFLNSESTSSRNYWPATCET